MLEDLCEITRSIKFTKSEDDNSPNLRSSPGYHQKNDGQYKCFRCYGINTDHCIQCSGSSRISSSHPLALLLNSILMKKIHFKKLAEQKNQQHESVQIIKEEEEDTDEKKNICSYCQLQCDFTPYKCPQCSWFRLCGHCEGKEKDNHQKRHKNVLSPIHRPFNEHPDFKQCFSCGRHIENCYSVCKTCKSLGENYWICDLCSDNNNYIHHIDHNMEAVIDFDTLKDSQMETISQEFSEELDHSISFSEQKIKQIDDMCLTRKNLSIAQQLQNEEDLPLLKGLISADNEKKHDPFLSRVKFEIDGLFNSYQFSSSFNITSKGILRTSSELIDVTKQNCNLSQTSKENIKDNHSCDSFKQYTFSGYKCDICQIQPIKNVRYHCSECADFDVCQKCYDSNLYTHLHTNFEKIDGKQIREKALQKILNCNKLPMLKTTLSLSVESNRSKPIRISTLVN